MKRERVQWCVCILLFTFTLPALAGAHAEEKVGIETCLKAAWDIKTGSFLKVEFLTATSKGVPTFALENRHPDGREWEFMCDATTGNIYEVEQEVPDPSHRLFAKHRQVSETDARHDVRNLYPGKIVEREYEIQSNGRPAYEFDVVSRDGQEMKVEVDAGTGEIIETAFEHWEIGYEPEEQPR